MANPALTDSVGPEPGVLYGPLGSIGSRKSEVMDVLRNWQHTAVANGNVNAPGIYRIGLNGLVATACGESNTAKINMKWLHPGDLPRGNGLYPMWPGVKVNQTRPSGQQYVLLQ